METYTAKTILVYVLIFNQTTKIEMFFSITDLNATHQLLHKCFLWMKMFNIWKTGL